MKTFEELGVSEDIRRAIEELGFVAPMPVQEEVIPYLLGENNDVIALAQTGTGKTAAFGLPLIQKTDVERLETQSLIICPTRELCLQIAGDLSDYGKYIKGLHVLPVYGGSSIESQIRSLKRGVQIIVATPGRLLDLMRRGAVSLQTVQNVVMDEADEMLDMGFSEDLNAILADVPEQRNTLMFSATMSNEIEKIAKTYLHDAKEITIGKRNESTHSVNHVAYCVHAKDKYEALKRIVDYYPDIYAIIFCRTRMETQEIADKLMQDGYNADALHGDLSQAARDLVMQKFRNRHLQLLVATDVAARGLDVDDLTHVINYGLPDDIEYYTHRSGRTGRAGKTGTSIAIMNLREKTKQRNIERVIGHEFKQGVMPTGKQICEKQLMKVIDQLEKVHVNEEDIADFMPDVYRKLDWLDKEELIKRMVSLEFNRFLDYYHDREEIEVVSTAKPKREKERGKRGADKKPNPRSRVAEPGYARLFINLGKKDEFTPKDLMALLNKNLHGRVVMGKIDLMQNFSFFEVEEERAEDVARYMTGANFKGRKVTVELTNDKEAASKPARVRKPSEHHERKYQEQEGGRRGRQRTSDKPAKPAKETKSSKSRGRKDDWKQFFIHDNDGLKGEMPNFLNEEGWQKKSKKKKK